MKLFNNPFFWLAVGVVVLIVVLIIVFNKVVDSKIRVIEKKDIEEKENQLKIRRAIENGEIVEDESLYTDSSVLEDTSYTQEQPIEQDNLVEENTKKEEKVSLKKQPEEVVVAPVILAEDETKTESSKSVEELMKDVPDAKDAQKVEDIVVTPVVAKEEKVAKTKKVEKTTKTTTKKTVVAPVLVKEVKEKTYSANGKWMIYPVGDDYFIAKLLANNGEILLETERYKAITGIKSGIETIKKNALNDNFEITTDKNDSSNYKLFGGNQSLLCIGEGYPSSESAKSAIESVKNFLDSEVIINEEVIEIEDKVFTIPESEKSDGGKWLISNADNGYIYAELKANNGQVLLRTENYKTPNSIRSGLDSIKANIIAGNFAIKGDKNDHYNFKLYSENKRLLALGAGYPSYDGCESAIISVMRFVNSPEVKAENETTAE